MINLKEITSGFQTAEARWARYGPYYAMFPLDFAFKVVNKYSKQGDYILDPFAGRCSSVYAGGVLGRHSLGIEINPVGWLYGKVKLRPADEEIVVDRLLEICYSSKLYRNQISKLPEFYRLCYCDEVLEFLLAARSMLKWKMNIADATLMSIILVYLHGKLGEGLSNQFKKAKAMGMQYSIKWWKENGLLSPPEINPIDFLMNKIKWRYEKGKPSVTESKVIYGDSTIKLDNVIEKSLENGIRFSLLFTSPPYQSVTDYYEDQWLRLWMLGGSECPVTTNHKYKRRFESQENYYYLLNDVFEKCSLVMKRNATIYVRTDMRQFTFETTLNILAKFFPKHSIEIANKPFTKKTQTEIHGNSSSTAGETDIILRR